MFLVALVVITVVELGLGRALDGGDGTTVSQVVRGARATPTPTPTPTPSRRRPTTPTVTSTPSVSRAPTTPAPTGHAEPTEPAVPSATVTATTDRRPPPPPDAPASDPAARRTFPTGSACNRSRGPSEPRGRSAGGAVDAGQSKVLIMKAAARVTYSRNSASSGSGRSRESRAAFMWRSQRSRMSGVTANGACRIRSRGCPRVSE